MKGNIGLSGRFEGLKKKVFKNEPKPRTASPHVHGLKGAIGTVSKHKRNVASIDFDKDLEID
jgi:hypothetical protein